MELQQGHILSVDFVESDSQPQIESFLCDYLSCEVPEWAPQMSTSFGAGVNSVQLERQHWGKANIDNSLFERFEILVVRIPELTDYHLLILLGVINIEEITDVSDDGISLSDLFSNCRDAWEGIFPENKFGLLARSAQVYKEQQRNFPVSSPLVFASGQVEVDDIGSLFDYPDGEITPQRLQSHQPFVRKLRNSELLSKFNLSSNGILTISNATDKGLLLTGQVGHKATGTQLWHDRYVFIEFHQEGQHNSASPMPFDTPGSSGIGTYPLYDAATRMLNIQPLIFLYYWFNLKNFQNREFSNTLKELSNVVTRDNNPDDIINFLHERESEFYADYVALLERKELAEALARRYVNPVSGTANEYGETGIPLLPDQTPPFNIEWIDENLLFDEKMGLFEFLSNEVLQIGEITNEKYNELKSRYDITVDELNQQLDLQISDDNRSLNQTLTRLTYILIAFGIIQISLSAIGTFSESLVSSLRTLPPETLIATALIGFELVAVSFLIFFATQE